MAPSPARAAPRQLQVMADLLQPFAGERAPELACALRDEFGTLAQAMAAPSVQLLRVGSRFGGAGELLLAARNLIDASNREMVIGSRVDPQDPALLTFLRSRLCSGRIERLLVVFCNDQDEYILDEEMGWGTAHDVRFDMAFLFRRALTLDATSILLAHNHPSGKCSPSEPDIDATRQLATMGQSLGIEFMDHLIITKKAAYSMRAGGLL